VVSQRLGLKGVKIAQNVTKVGVHACISNGHPNLWSNFNCEKIVKSETSSCIFARFRLKAGPNSSKHCKSWRACFYIKWASKSMIKFQLWEFGQKWNSIIRFGKVWLKGGENSSEHHEIFMHSYLTRNIAKICVHTYLPNGHICAFAKVTLKGSESSSKRYESWRVRLFIEMGT